MVRAPKAKKKARVLARNLPVPVTVAAAALCTAAPALNGRIRFGPGTEGPRRPGIPLGSAVREMPELDTIAMGLGECDGTRSRRPGGEMAAGGVELERGRGSADSDGRLRGSRIPISLCRARAGARARASAPGPWQSTGAEGLRQETDRIGQQILQLEGIKGFGPTDSDKGPTDSDRDRQTRTWDRETRT